jgi:hypothetical protein
VSAKALAFQRFGDALAQAVAEQGDQHLRTRVDAQAMQAEGERIASRNRCAGAISRSRLRRPRPRGSHRRPDWDGSRGSTRRD